ncbi:scm-like with four MBT domains protein 1 [Paramacrobiotus metropolitanus]|uniref:scm-like with four MBT domains protein 1 n=1 Tax=Paramacrobiotus metropolitanus TaxID=2943436 RepID=UPI002445EC64|nr:scm-like with four MBT domains protein 1 [Paramacrobiotus metropolitanus]
MPQSLVPSAVRGMSWHTLAENPQQPDLPAGDLCQRTERSSLQSFRTELSANSIDRAEQTLEALARQRIGTAASKDTLEAEQIVPGEENLTDHHATVVDSDASSQETEGIATGSSDASRAEMEFSWELCLEELNAHPVPPEAFQHVADSLINGLHEGQCLEYVYSGEGTKKAVWYVELIYAHDSYVFVRYLGLEEQPQEAFWLDLTTADVSACVSAFDRNLHRPPKIVMKYQSYLGKVVERSKKGLPTPDAQALMHRGRALKDRIEVGHLVEITDQQCGMTVWPAVVKKNIGGRLQLEYWKGTEEDVVWVFCTEHRLRPFRFGMQNGYKYSPPSGVTVDETGVTETVNFVQEFDSKSSKFVPVPANVFSKFELPVAQFAKGDHVEVIHPHLRHQISPAVVTEVFPNQTVAVEILDFRGEDKKEKIVQVYDNDSLELLPIHWCKKNGIKLSRPPGWDPPTDKERREKDKKEKEKKEKPEFSWQKIVDEYGGAMASQKCFSHLNNVDNRGFSRGMKLEMSNPTDPEEICMATILKVFPPLLWIRIDSYGQSASYIVTFTSTEIFPAGFCGSNNYSLKLPRFMVHGQRMAAIRSRSQGSVSPGKSPRSPREGNESPGKSKNGELITLHVNPKCNCGPLMSPKKVISLPKSMGPGPVQLVLQCLITSLISCGTRPTKLLQLIGASGESPRSANWERVRIKAKLAGRRQMLLVDVVKNASQVPDFLRNICILCEACPNLITTEPYSGRCPDRCYLFIKPDLKNLQVRRRIPRNNTKDSLNDDAQSSLDNSIDGDALDADFDAEDPKMDGDLTVRMTVGPGDFEEGSQTGFDEEMDTTVDSQEPSRAASVESEEAPPPKAVNAKSSERSKRKANETKTVNGGDSSAVPLRKRFRRGPPYSKVDSGLRVPIPVSRPIDVNVVEGPPSPSSSEEETQESFATSRRNIAELVRISLENGDSDVDIENNPVTNGRLVDDSEYLMHFFKHPRKWTVEETYSFLVRQLPQSEAPDILREEMIDGDALLLMVASDLRHLRIDSRDATFVASLIERMLFSIILTKGQQIPLYSSWK